MPLPKSRKSVGLGKAIIRDRFKGNRPRNGDNILHTTDLDDGPNWTKLRSITQERDLDEFLSTAQLAGTNFTAERLNIKVVTNTHHNPFLLDAEKEKETLAKHEANKERLTIPRRPIWDKQTTSEQLERNEKDAFLQWRRELAFLQEQDFLMTPFEKNIEIWRQLWRVIERSDIIIQIVDARNPLFFRSTDLEKYVKEVDKRKKNLLLVNKADLLTAKQRKIWAYYLESQGIRYIFFSATLAQKELEDEFKRKELAVTLENLEIASGTKEDTEESKRDKEFSGAIPEEDDESKDTAVVSDGDGGGDPGTSPVSVSDSEEPSLSDAEDNRIRIRTANELEAFLVAEADTYQDSTDLDSSRKLTIGLVGYPNVGKSSTINALLGAKRVSVSSTPGKTKHFQTIHLSPQLLLCDCPGLVFPNFATTNADMVCNGILPIDQLREHTGPVALVVQRIPQAVLEAIYGVKIRTRGLGERGDNLPSAEELLVAYAVARGFTKSAGGGEPDESRSARYILKDYVNGKLPYNHPPPIAGILPGEFNAELHDLKRFIKQRKKKTTVVNMLSVNGTNDTDLQNNGSSIKDLEITDSSWELDRTFFNKQESRSDEKRFVLGVGAGEGGSFTRNVVYQTSTAGAMPSGKKHYKKGKRNNKNRNSSNVYE